MMTTPQTPAPSLVTPYAPSWALYVYGTHGYLTYSGGLIATATVGTPSQEARVRAMFARLTASPAAPVVP